MTITINPTASQDPFTNANLSQSNSGTCSSDGSSLVTQKNTSTVNRLYANVGFSTTQSVQATIGYIANEADLWNMSSGVILLLYTDANNWAGLAYEHNGTNDNWARLRTCVGGSQTDTNFATVLADAYFAAGDQVKLAVTWSGADATFTLTKNGGAVGSSVTKTSFGLTSGVPGFAAERTASNRGVGFSQLVFTGESGSGTGTVSIKGNRGPRVAFGSARVGF